MGTGHTQGLQQVAATLQGTVPETEVHKRNVFLWIDAAGCSPPGVAVPFRATMRTLGTKMVSSSPGTVAHTCNSSYLGGRDQEDHGTRPAWANSS
jgi:hypothetical protein